MRLTLSMRELLDATSAITNVSVYVVHFVQIFIPILFTDTWKREEGPL